ncbi:MAG: DUF3261 domain-containing protein [Nitrospirae bacterium]|nr:DUF3261 domain-containing protein [Nitrospirota bacterium]
MKRLLIILILFACITSCAGIPFQKASEVPMESADPWALVEEFRGHSPENFMLINSIVFDYNWNKLSGLGYIKVDAKEKTFTVVCINPMGVKLFELAGDKDRIDSHFAMEQFTKKGNFPRTVGEDIRRIYFDLTPSASAEVKKRKYKVIFDEPLGAGVVEYIFAGEGGHLVEKNYYEDSRLNWRVSYYEYRQKDGKIYPSGIILDNYKYGYGLTIKLKEIRG